MKQLILIFALLAGPIAACAQVQFPYIIPSATDPNGKVCTTDVQLVWYAGTYYGCDGTGHYASLGGSGGGNLSGTLTADVYPIASGAHTLVDGAIDQDITYPDYLTIQPATGKSIQIISNGDTNGSVVIYACNDDKTTCDWLDLQSPASGNGSEFVIQGNTFRIDTPPTTGQVLLGHSAGSYQFVVTAYGYTSQAQIFPTVNVGSLVTSSTNNFGTITLSGQTSVTLTFAGSGFPHAVSCTASPSVSLATAPYISAISGTSVTFTFPALTGNLYYNCQGN